VSQIIFLCIFAFLAGLIDSIVGGGGLIQLPALLIFLPNTAIPLIFGTNKLSSIVGTLAAAIRFSQEVTIDWSIVLISTTSAFICSFIGASAISIINPALMRPLILLMLVTVAIYTWFKKDLGLQHIIKVQGVKKSIYATLIGSLLGFYDGFFGPGTGSFLIFAFIGLLGFDFLRASASAKVVNFSTNLAAIIYFTSTNSIIYSIAIPMGVCNVFGAIIGAKLAIIKGSAFVRVFFIGVVSLLIVKLAYDMLFNE
jgi:hypothetical protein